MGFQNHHLHMHGISMNLKTRYKINISIYSLLYVKNKVT